MTVPLATGWVVEVLDILAWPVVVVSVVWGLTTKSGLAAVERLLRPMRRVKAFGVELELGQDEGRRIKVSLEETFKDYRTEVELEFDRQVERYDVGRLCAGVAEEVIKPLLKEPCRRNFKCTVYVADIVFKDVLYRLLDYYPAGDGRGSIYSARFGIIGRAWRLGTPQYEAKVPGDAKTLITQWGMTLEEASGHAAKSFLTFQLHPAPVTPAVGLLYFESDENAFEEDPLPKLQADSHVAELTKAVEKVMTQMRGAGPMLDLFKN